MIKAIGLAVALATLAVSAHASIIDYRVSGTIGGSFDQSGVFGTPETTLINDPFLAEFKFDTSKGVRTDLSPNYDLLEKSFGNPDPLLSAVLTINGHTYAFNHLDQDSISVAQPQQVSGATSFDTMSGTQTRNVSFITAYAQSSATPGSLDQSFAGPALNFALFSLDNFQVAYDDNGQSTYAYGSLNVDHVESIVTEVSAAPEPGVWALMIAGIGLMGAALHRRRRLGGLATA